MMYTVVDGIKKKTLKKTPIKLLLLLKILPDAILIPYYLTPFVWCALKSGLRVLNICNLYSNNYLLWRFGPYYTLIEMIQAFRFFLLNFSISWCLHVVSF